MKSWIEQFILAREAEGLSISTLTWYRRHLDGYAEFVRLSGRKWDDTETIRLFLVGLRDDGVRYKEHPFITPRRRKLSKASIRAYHRALSTFFNWLVSEGHFEISPMKGIKAPRNDKDLPKTIDQGDFIKLLDAARGRPREEALLLFLADTGVRDAEARTMLRSNLDLVRQQALVKGKGNKERRVYFTATTAAALARYLSTRYDDDPHVFVGQRGPLGQTAIYQILKRLAKRAGITGRFNPHAFRHFFASQYVANGGDLETLRRMLGHTDIDTTRRYLHFRDEVMRSKHDQYSPITQLIDTSNNDSDSPPRR